MLALAIALLLGRAGIEEGTPIEDAVRALIAERDSMKAFVRHHTELLAHCTEIEAQNRDLLAERDALRATQSAEAFRNLASQLAEAQAERDALKARLERLATQLLLRGWILDDVHGASGQPVDAPRTQIGEP